MCVVCVCVVCVVCVWCVWCVCVCVCVCVCRGCVCVCMSVEGVLGQGELHHIRNTTYPHFCLVVVPGSLGGVHWL